MIIISFSGLMTQRPSSVKVIQSRLKDMNCSPDEINDFLKACDFPEVDFARNCNLGIFTKALFDFQMFSNLDNAMKNLPIWKSFCSRMKSDWMTTLIREPRVLLLDFEDWDFRKQVLAH